MALTQGFSLWGRGKIECETKRGKEKDFRLGGTKEGGEQQQGLPQKIKESSQERELCVEKKIKMKEQSVITFERDN